MKKNRAFGRTLIVKPNEIETDLLGYELQRTAVVLSVGDDFEYKITVGDEIALKSDSLNTKIGEDEYVIGYINISHFLE
jgi:hypothetical protein